MAKRKIYNLNVSYSNEAHGEHLDVTVHRREPRTVRFYMHATRASLLRANRAQRLLIRRVVDGYVAPLVTIEPETNTELRQANDAAADEAGTLPVVPGICAEVGCYSGTVDGSRYCNEHGWALLDATEGRR